MGFFDAPLYVHIVQVNEIALHELYMPFSPFLDVLRVVVHTYERLLAFCVYSAPVSILFALSKLSPLRQRLLASKLENFIT